MDGSQCKGPTKIAVQACVCVCVCVSETMEITLQFHDKIKFQDSKRMILSFFGSLLTSMSVNKGDDPS